MFAYEGQKGYSTPENPIAALPVFEHFHCHYISVNAQIRVREREHNVIYIGHVL